MQTREIPDLETFLGQGSFVAYSGKVEMEDEKSSGHP